MTKLTDNQLAILAQAAGHDGGCATLPNTLSKASAMKVGASLVARKLMREVRAKAGWPVWRDDADGRSLCLVITKQGRLAAQPTEAAVSGTKAAKAATKDQQADIAAAPQVAGASAAIRAGSKGAEVVALLSAPGGATLDALVDATGWLPHTTRAALTGLRKRGFAIERSKEAGQRSTYRIVAPTDAKAAA